MHGSRINNLMIYTVDSDTIPNTQQYCWLFGHSPHYRPPFCLDCNGERRKGTAFPKNHMQKRASGLWRQLNTIN